MPGTNNIPQFVNIFKNSLHTRPKKTLEVVAEGMAEDARKAIQDQEFNHKPLNDDYLWDKIRHNLDPRILIRTGEYVDSIGVYRTPDGMPIVGVDPNMTHTESGLPMYVLARIHEFGSAKANIPARPVWRIVHKRWAGKKKVYRRWIRQDIEADVRRRSNAR